VPRRDAPTFSRPRHSTGFGKNLVPAKTLVPGNVRERATAKVKTDGYANLAEWLRDVIIAKAEGIHVLRSVAERRISSVSAIVPKKDRER
jgi:hypothetical protein